MTKTNWLWRICALLVALTALPLGAALADGMAADVTGSCGFVEPSEPDRVKKLTDGSVRTFLTLPPDRQVRFTLPAGAQGIYLEWLDPPGSFTLEQLDEAGASLCADGVDDPGLSGYYPLLPQAREAALYGGAELTLATVQVYGQGSLPKELQNWLPPAEKCDLLLVSAHCDDELLYFGGALPTYAGERGDRVQVAYMAHGKRLRQSEAMAGLWLCGVRNEPIFLGFRDSYSQSLETAERQWGRDTVVEALVALIRRTKPEVIVTHDLEGEYGHGAHRITASCMLEAVTLAADGSQYPASGETYGAWQAKKLYLHLYPENQVLMDWRVPLTAFDGRTALDMANLAYQCHVSQLEYHTAVHDTGDDNCALFGLAYTTVGPDEEKNDFLEHIPAEALTGYVAPTPSPTPEPTPTPTPAVTAAPAYTAEPEPAERGTAFPFGILLACGGALLLALAGLLLIRRKNK